MVKTIQISILSLIFLLVVFLFIKIKKSSNNAGNVSNSSYQIMKKYRYGYFVYNDKWKFKYKDDKLVTGKFYYLIEQIDEINNCFLGLFYLKNISEQGVFFGSEKKEVNSKLELYAKIYAKNIIKYVISENILDTELANLEYCENWVKL